MKVVQRVFFWVLGLRRGPHAAHASPLSHTPSPKHFTFLSEIPTGRQCGLQQSPKQGAGLPQTAPPGLTDRKAAQNPTTGRWKWSLAVLKAEKKEGREGEKEGKRERGREDGPEREGGRERGRQEEREGGK